MDEVIALAVGIPSVILAGVAVWYARRNDIFQRMSGYWRRTHTGGHNAGYNEWGSGTHIAGHNLGSPEWGSVQGSNFGHSANRGPYY